MSYGSQPSLVLCELWQRESSRGNVYFSGFLGGLSVALLRDGERPHPTRPDETIVVWKLLLQERQPRPAAQKPAASPPERDEAPMPAKQAPAVAGARPGGSQPPQRRYRPEGKAAQRERVSAEIASGYGLGEGDPDDPLPF
jgi:hypothetical protein